MNNKKNKKELFFLGISIMISVAIASLFLRNIIDNFWIQLGILLGIMAVVGLILGWLIRWNRSRQTHRKNA